MPVGFRIKTEIERPDAALVERFVNLSPPDISDVMRESNTMDRGIVPVYTPMRRVVGPAVTVSVPTGSMSVIKLGIKQTQPGDVLVVNCKGMKEVALVGANMLRGLFSRGAAGFIIDGAVRDPIAIREEEFAVFARHITTAGGPSGPEVGEVNVPIACGGVVVNPGDIVVADEDGIAVVPPAEAEEILEGVRKLEESHAAIQEVLLREGVTNIAAIEQRMREAGFEFS